ncbi:hypothetical protein [Rhizobium rhizosphaerae]|nr:hypothetical protein [Xaviernesmea rhizosphaerae]
MIVLTIVLLGRGEVSGEAKVRWGVETPRGFFELFSVMQRPADDLLINFRSADNHEDHDGTDVGIVAERISVHPSDDSSGTTIKYTGPLADGRYQTASAFIEGPKQRLLFPLWAQYVPRLDKKYAANPRSKDQLIKLGCYDDRKTCMVFTVFISHTNRPVPLYPDRWGNVTVHDFRRFRVLVYSAFIPFLSLPGYDFSLVATSPLQVTQSPQKPQSGGAISCTDQEAQMLIDWFATSMLRKYNTRLAKLVESFPTGSTNIANEDASKMTSMLLVAPLEDLEASQDQLPLIFIPSLPATQGAEGFVVSIGSKAVGKVYPC